MGRKITTTVKCWECRNRVTKSTAKRIGNRWYCKYCLARRKEKKVK